jgi:glycosyltransferase involved in cell wall biosynthesis
LKIKYPVSNSTILNGADNRIFFPSNNNRSELNNKVIIISNSWSTNHNKGFKTIASFSELNRVEVLHIGRWPEDISSKYVKLLGTLPEREIAEVLKKGKFFLFPSKNEACPNVVVEALATGLPVFYHDSGGTPELCHNGMLGMALPKDSFDLVTLNEFIESALAQYRNMRKLILEKMNLFSFEYCYNKYVEYIWNEIL